MNRDAMCDEKYHTVATSTIELRTVYHGGDEMPRLAGLPSVGSRTFCFLRAASGWRRERAARGKPHGDGDDVHGDGLWAEHAEDPRPHHAGSRRNRSHRQVDEPLQAG